MQNGRFHRQNGMARKLTAKEKEELSLGQVIFFAEEGNGRVFLIQITSLIEIRKFQTG